jgi:RNA polymerase sigma-70 factor (ECF subfamily)
VGETSTDDFDRLVRDNQRAVYQIALSIVGSVAEAQDVVQDTFVRAHAKLDRLSDPRRFRAWVCQIARRVALNRLRSASRARKREETFAGEAVSVVDVEALAEERDYQRSVYAAIDRLPVKLREALLLCAIEGLEPSEVALMLGIPSGTVRSRLHSARRQLLERLSP